MSIWSIQMLLHLPCPWVLETTFCNSPKGVTFPAHFIILAFINVIWSTQIMKCFVLSFFPVFMWSHVLTLLYSTQPLTSLLHSKWQALFYTHTNNEVQIHSSVWINVSTPQTYSHVTFPSSPHFRTPWGVKIWKCGNDQT